MTSPRLSLIALLCAVPFAACGGGDEPAATAAATTATATPIPTPGGGGADAVQACLSASDAALELQPRAGELVLEGVDAATYDVVAVDQDGSIGMQAVVFASEAEAEAARMRVEAHGFFDDVRPAGNAIVIRRGGDAPGTERVVACGYAA